MMENESKQVKNKVKRRSSFGRPRNSIGIPSNIDENKFVDQQLCSEVISKMEFDKIKLYWLQSYCNQLKAEELSWRELLPKYEAQADASQQLSEAVVTIECDARCISDVNDKSRLVLQSTPDYGSAVSSLQEFDDCNTLCADVAAMARGCLKSQQREHATFVQDQLSRLNELLFDDTIEDILFANNFKIGNES